MFCQILIIHIERNLQRQCISSDAYSGRLVYYGDVTGDDMQAVQFNLKRTGNYYHFDWLPKAQWSQYSHWSYLYSIIQNCNLILDDIDNDRNSIYTMKMKPIYTTMI